jgi:hypothetical protein
VFEQPYLVDGSAKLYKWGASKVKSSIDFLTYVLVGIYLIITFLWSIIHNKVCENKWYFVNYFKSNRIRTIGKYGIK